MTDQSRFDPLALPAATPKPRRRWLRRVVVAIVVALICLVGSYGALYWWALSARDAEIAKLRAAGEPVWFDELRPEPLDPAEDGTPLLRQAFAAMTPLPGELADEMRTLTDPDEEEMDPADEARFLEEFGDTPVEPQGITLREFLANADKADPKPRGPRLPLKVRESLLVEKLRPHVEANREAFALLAKSLEKAHLRFDEVYDNPARYYFESRRDLVSVWNLVALLDARWRCAIHDGDVDAAADAIDGTLRFAKGLHATAKSLMDSLTTVALVGNGLEQLGETLGRGDVAQPQRRRLQGTFVQLESSIRVQPSLRAERATAMTIIESYLEHGDEGQPLLRAGLLRDLCRPIVWLNEVHYLESMNPRVEYADRVDDEALDALAALGEREWNELDPQNMGVLERPIRYAQGMLLPMLAFHAQAPRLRDRLQAARVALRVDAYRREHGRLPKLLDDVRDDVLAEIPRDVVYGEPLAFLTAEDAFSVCPADEAAREQKRLAAAVFIRDAELKLAAADDDAADGGRVPEKNADGGDTDDGTDDETDDGDVPSGAFRVVYARP